MHPSFLSGNGVPYAAPAKTPVDFRPPRISTPFLFLFCLSAAVIIRNNLPRPEFLHTIADCASVPLIRTSARAVMEISMISENSGIAGRILAPS